MVIDFRKIQNRGYISNDNSVVFYGCDICVNDVLTEVYEI